MSVTTLLLALAPLTNALSLGPLPSIWKSTSSNREESRAGLRRRNATVIPAPIDVGPSQYWDGIDGPWSSFPIQLGTQPQNIRALLSTASYATWAISGLPLSGADSCPAGFPSNCSDTRGTQFFSNESLSWVPNSIYEVGIEINLDMDPAGAVGFDTVALGWQGDSVSVPHSAIWNILDASYWVGVFGVNPLPSNFSNLNDPQPSFMAQLFNSSKIPGLNYAYTAGNKYRLNQVFGSLVLGGYDQNRFTPTNVTFGMYADISRDLLVNIQSITSDSGNVTNLLPDGSIAAFIDSTISTIWLPQSACTAFEEAFGLTYDDSSKFYLVNTSLHETLLSTNANVTFTLSPEVSGGETVDIVLPYGAFDLQVEFPLIGNPNTSYYFPLMRANSSTQYTLGRTFLQEAYLIADYERNNFTVAPCLWDANKVASADIKSILSPKTILPGSSSSSSSISAGAIAGIVIGVVAGIALLGALLWFFLRRKTAEKRRRIAELEAHDAHASEPKRSDDSVTEHNPLIESDRGELDGGQIHELNAPYAKHAELDSAQHGLHPGQAGYSEMEGGPHGKDAAHEMPAGQGEVFEMQGSDVQEMSGDYSRDLAKRAQAAADPQAVPVHRPGEEDDREGVPF